MIDAGATVLCCTPTYAMHLAEVAAEEKIDVAAAKVIQKRRRLALATVIALLALDIGYAVYMQAYGVTHGLDSDPATNSVPVY